VSRAAQTILKVWLGLFALLALTTAMAFVQLGSANLAIALSIAIAKAALVLWFFMELKGSAGLTRAFALAGFFWLLILVVLTWADYSQRRDVMVPVTISSPRVP
jgi:cytochrome c oxidase subunit 4